MLARLSPRQRELLQLVFYHDLTVEDAADVLHTEGRHRTQTLRTGQG
jgi:DNA-directed RNA polymerase specialized sigma24 family protein